MKLKIIGSRPRWSGGSLIPFFFWVSLWATGCQDPKATAEDQTTPGGGSALMAGEEMAGEEMAGEITAGEITAGEITAGEITAGEITAGEITAGEITAGEITAGENTGGISCDVEATLTRSGCQSVGCHGTPTRSSLHLVGDDLERQMVNHPSTISSCAGRVILDPERPERSLLLQAVGAEPPPQGEMDACQVVMPYPSGGVSEEDQACFREWVLDIASRHSGIDPEIEFEASPLSSALRKVKTLLHGDSPTPDELTRASSGAEGFKSLISEWVETERGQLKLMSFFQLALQQRLQEEDIEQFDRLRRHRGLNAPFARIMTEAFARTALHIINENRSFKQIATTREWMVTTANLVLLLYPDQSLAQRNQRHVLTPNASEAPSSLSQQVAQKTWLIPSLPGNCQISQIQVLEMLFGFVLDNPCDNLDRNLRFEDHPLTEEDFLDWRLVAFSRQADLSDEESVPFYDLPTLRNATEIVSRLPRVGFFTTSVFFNNWPTNVDNQFRVVTNQALITGLHQTFSSSEPTEPLSSEGLDADHANEPDCLGCHRQLDPMRVYFADVFNAHYQLPRDQNGEGLLLEDNPTPSFAFMGETDQGGGLGRLGRLMADHARFPIAWVQKLCLYANSSRCDEGDPEFIRISQVFRESGFNFKSLLVELFSSALITHLSEPESLVGKDPNISITRREHLCALLAERTGRADICEVSRVRSVLGLIPQDSYARGAVDFTQPSLPSAFYFAAVENLCEEASRVVVIAANEYFSFDLDLEVFLGNIISKLMGIPADQDRYLPMLNQLRAHYDAALEVNPNQRIAKRSVFSLACVSPDVMGVGL